MATNLRPLREARGLTQYRLAKMSGVPQSTIWRIEAGEQDPGGSIAVALSDALECSLDAFFDRKPPQEAS